MRDKILTLVWLFYYFFFAFYKVCVHHSEMSANSPQQQHRSTGDFFPTRFSKSINPTGINYWQLFSLICRHQKDWLTRATHSSCLLRVFAIVSVVLRDARAKNMHSTLAPSEQLGCANVTEAHTQNCGCTQWRAADSAPPLLYATRAHRRNFRWPLVGH